MRNNQQPIANNQQLHVSRFTFHAPALIALLIIAVLYVAGLLAMPPEGFTQHDTGAKYLQVRNLRLTPGGLDWSINYPANNRATPLDPGMEFVPFSPKQHYVDSSNRIYLQWPIFLGLLTRIPWKVLSFWGLYTVPLLAGLATLWATYLLTLSIGVPRRVAWLAVPLVGLATPVSIYSLLYFEHTLASLLVTLSLLALSSVVSRQSSVVSDEGAGVGTHSRFMSHVSRFTLGPQSSVFSPALSGISLALAVYFRSELYVLALVIVLVLAFLAWRGQIKRRQLVAWVVAFMAALVPLWLFYAISEGTFLPLHATWYFAASDGGGGGTASSGGIDLPRLRYLASAGFGVVPDFLFGPQQFPLAPAYPWWAGAAGLVGVALCALAALGRLVARLAHSPWRLYLLVAGMALLLVPCLLVLFSPDAYYNLHGFLLASPFIVLALWPVGRQHEEDPEENPKSKIQNPKSPTPVYPITLLYVGFHALVISALSGLGPISRHEWGQRYLLPAYPALVALALLAGWAIWQGYVPRLRRWALAGLALAGVLALVGVGFTARGYVMLGDERGQVVSWLNLARTLPPREPLVTDVWWLPLNLAADFYTRPMMLAEGNDRLVRWANEMHARGIASFGLMTNDPATLSAPWQKQVPGLHTTGPPEQSRGMWLQRYSW